MNETKAQTVWGISGYDYDQNQHQLYGYHSTEVDYWAWLYYDVYVEGVISDQYGSELDFDSDFDGNMKAEAYTQATYTPGEYYYVISDHWLVAYYSEPAPGGGGGSYWNPFGYGFSPGGGYGGFFGFSPGTGGYTYSQYIYLGWTGWELYFYGEPHIDQMVPTSAPLGQSIEVNFEGTSFGTNPTINVSGSGISVGSPTFSTDTRLTAIFNIAENASTGNHSVSITTSEGVTSNSVNLNVGDRTPVINSINPSNGDAGQVVPVTISGTGFGSTPIVDVTGGINVQITSRNNTQITANFTIPSNTTPGNHEVRVTSNGYGGTGFISGGGSSSTSNAVNFTVNAQAAPHITSYAPQSGQLDTSIEINVIGENFTNNRTLQISGQGVTVQSYTNVADPDHQIVAILNIAENAETGNHAISVSTGTQTSNSVNFQVGDQTPTITSITPPSGTKGTNTQVVLTGRGFGINPQLAISGTGVNITINSATDTRITANFAISGLAEQTIRQVTLTSQGISGSGFIQSPGATPNAQANFGIDAAKVKINSVDKRFAPSVERLNVNYTITPVGYNAPVGRLEIFKKGDTTNPIYRDTSIPTGGTNVQYTQGGTPGWDGMANMGAGAGKFVGPEDSPFTVRVTIAADGSFGTTKMDQKEFKVELDSIETTPKDNNEYNIVKPQPTTPPVPAQTPEIATEVKVVIKLKNKAGTGVPTAIPFKLNWSFEDPDDTSGKNLVDPNGSTGDDNAPISNLGKRGPGSIMWRAVTGTTTAVDPAGRTAVSDAIVTPGPDLGSAKISFLSSNVAADNYILKLEVKNSAGTLVKEVKFKKWSVRKALTFTRFFKMQNGVDVKSVASYDNVHEAFDEDGYTDYTTGQNQTNLTAAQSPEFAVALLAPNAAETPTNQEKVDYAAGSAAAKQAIEGKAQAWFQRNYLLQGNALVAYAGTIGAPAFSLIGCRFISEKFDGRPNPNGTNHYPAGITIVGSDGLPHDPDDDWGEIEGGEVGGFAFIFLNTKPMARLIVAARHEVGHASDHELFGLEDHALSGLMHKNADQGPNLPYGNENFNEDSILRLRGWSR
ncbi:MAG TPA: IPT/TIG domain-containing protein [Pyrinomonadaceae bacterium]